MSEQKESKNKIGARCLSDVEAELILPTYRRIYHQIEQFRTEKESMDRKKHKENGQDENQKGKNKDIDQKTNNIGIMGVRGAGKTSVLKTIRARLEKDKQNSKSKDIILPVIVPENMSEFGTLMATILGMLSEVIKDRDEEAKRERKGSNADCIRKSSLRTKYDEVIKQYTYIQNEYRNILIQQYTTENDYVNRSAKVFNSDTEFIDKFNELVDELVNEPTDAEKQHGSLLFLFIDDIDLSTHRCADVVKTLLSYLSNENIVTFISGDFETFEEALTLDFLRQENVLGKEIIEKKFGSMPLLDSKKRLAYEYLKKIIPPAYRYIIKNWSIEEKGNYCIVDSEENRAEGTSHREELGAGKQKAGITLSDLLFQALEGWVDPAFFRYGEIKDETEDSSRNENRDNNEKSQMAGKILPYTYHLFDNTSRGLNNVYNVLGEIAAARKGEMSDYSREKKLLLDTIISSKLIYNDYREDIQKNFFRVGTTKAECRVFFDNARAIIYRKDIMKNSEDNLQNQEEYKEKYHISNPEDRFSLFILADFAARLLYEKDYEKQIQADEGYKILKEKAMEELFFHPIIAEKVMEVSSYSWESKEETALKEKALKEAAFNRWAKEYPELKDMKLKYVNSSFLLKGDLVLNLAYYKNLPLDGMLKLYEDKLSEGSDQERLVTSELEQSAVIAMWRAFSSIAVVNAVKDVSEIIAKYYSVFWKEFAYIRNQMSSSVTQNIAIRLFDDETSAVAGKGKKNTGLQNTDAWKERRERVQMQRILSNTLARVLQGQGGDVIQKDWQEIPFNDICIVENGKEEKWIEKEEAVRKDIEGRVRILKAIDSGKLWQAEAAGDAVAYLRKEIKEYLRFIKKALEESESWKLNTSDVYDEWQKFLKLDVGKTMTIARRTRNSVQNILKVNQTDFGQGMSLGIYRKVISELEELAGNDRVWYGQSEAQKILNEMQKASAEPAIEGEDWDTWIRKHSYFMFLLQCLYRYKTVAGQSKNIEQNACLLTDVSKKLSAAHIEADRQTLENFIVELNKNLDGEDKADSEYFEKLFS